MELVDLVGQVVLTVDEVGPGQHLHLVRVRVRVGPSACAHTRHAP